MPELTQVLSKREIETRVADIAKQLSADYDGRKLILVGVLKGAFVFLSDLIRHLTIPLKIDFIGLSSYGSSTSSSGNIRVTKHIETALKGYEVLIVEDIVDTGQTLQYLIDYLKPLAPASVRTCCLIDKPERRINNIHIDYACIKIPEGFLVGYGLDYDEEYRNLSDIYRLIF